MVFVIFQFMPYCSNDSPIFWDRKCTIIWNGECDYNEFSPIPFNLRSSSSQMISFPSVEEGELGATLKPKLQRRDTDLVTTEHRAAYCPVQKGPRGLRDLDTETASSCSSLKPPPATKETWIHGQCFLIGLITHHWSVLSNHNQNSCHDAWCRLSAWPQSKSTSAHISKHIIF